MIKYFISLFTIYRLPHDMLIALVGRVGQFILMFISIRYMTQILSPREVGLATLITTTTAFFALCFVNPVGMYFNRRLHSWVTTNTSRQKFLWYMTYVIGVSVMSSFAIFTIAENNIITIDIPILWLVFLICSSLIFNTAFQTIIPAFNLLGHVKPFVILNLSMILIGLILSIVLTNAFKPKAEYWLMGTIISQVIIFPFAYSLFFVGVPSSIPKFQRLNRQTISYVFFFSWPITISVFLQWVQMQGYRFYLDVTFGLEELGMYAAGYGIAASLTSATETILTTWFQPRFYKSLNSTDETERDNAWNNYAKMMIPGAALALTALLAAAPSLPRLMLGPAFQNTVLYIMLGALAEWSRVMVGVVSLEAHQRMSTARLILPYATGVTVTYIFLFIMIDIAGINTAPIAICMGGSATAIYLYIIIKRGSSSKHTDIQLVNITNNKYIAILILATCGSIYIQNVFLDLTSLIIALSNCFAIFVMWTVFSLYRYRSILTKQDN